MPIRYPRRAGMLIKTRQTTCYHVGDDGDFEVGLDARYEVLTAGQYAGTTAIDTPHYANNGLSFVAPNQINDAGAGLVTFLATDTIRVRGSASNDGVYTVSVGGVAGQIITVQNTIVNEGAGRYVTLCKRSSPSNNCVMDLVTGLMWKRYPTTATGLVERVGDASIGMLNFFAAANVYTLHPAAADLQMMVTGIKIVGGAAELPRYFAGMIVDCAGFANAVNNLPGYRVTSVAVNGADLDILLWTGRQTLIAEAAGGARSIGIVCRSIYAYAGAANAAGFGGYTDWRNPDVTELPSLRDMEAASAVPDAVAFPNWPTTNIFTSTTRPNSTADAMLCEFSAGQNGVVVKSFMGYGCAMVRG